MCSRTGGPRVRCSADVDRLPHQRPGLVPGVAADPVGEYRNPDLCLPSEHGSRGLLPRPRDGLLGCPPAAVRPARVARPAHFAGRTSRHSADPGGPRGNHNPVDRVQRPAHLGTRFRERLGPSRAPVRGVLLAFLVMTLLWEVFVPVGRLLGKLMSEHPDTIRAYSANVAGSLCGIWLFVLASALYLPPAAWFAFFAAGAVF